MNKRDKVQLDMLLEQPKFFDLYLHLTSLHFRKFRNLITNSILPSAGQIAKGKQPRISTVVNPGQSEKEILSQTFEYIKEATWLAEQLTSYFPAARHRYWQHIFLDIALGGTGTVKQQQAGGRKKQTCVSEKTAKLYEKYANDYWQSGMTKLDFCAEIGKSQSTLSRALRYMNRKKCQRIDNRSIN